MDGRSDELLAGARRSLEEDVLRSDGECQKHASQTPHGLRLANQAERPVRMGVFLRFDGELLAIPGVPVDRRDPVFERQHQTIVDDDSRSWR